MKKISLALFCGVLLVAGGGCGYRLGSLLPSTMKSVAVPNFKNYTIDQPSLSAIVTNGVIERFQVDGTLQVAPQDEADTLLIGEIIDYKRAGLRVSTTTDATTEYRLTIAVRLTFKDLKTGKVLWVANRIEGENTFPPGLSTPEAERAAIPGAVEDLAEHVVKKVVDAGW